MIKEIISIQRPKRKNINIQKRKEKYLEFHEQ